LSKEAYSTPKKEFEQAVKRDVEAPRFLELAAPETLPEQRSLVLGDRVLHLQQELVVGVLRDRTIDEHNLRARALELLEQQHLVGVLACQTVRAQNPDHLESSVLGAVTQRAQPRAVEPGARLALVGVDVLGRKFVAVFICPALQSRKLVFYGPLPPLTRVESLA
jgi:hypothetical protein